MVRDDEEGPLDRAGTRGWPDGPGPLHRATQGAAMDLDVRPLDRASTASRRKTNAYDRTTIPR